MRLYDSKLAYFRKSLRVSQQELSEDTGINRWALQLIETGHRVPTKEEKVACVKSLRKARSRFSDMLIDESILFPILDGVIWKITKS